jgi:hypothetical protein
MGAVSCQVASGDIGAWTAVGAFVANMNDGDDATFNSIVGSGAGAFTLLYDETVIPTGAAITSVSVSGNCSNNSGGAAQVWTCYLGAANTVIGSFTADNTNYAFTVARPGGGTWTKAELGTMYLYVACDGLGGGNPMRVRSSVLTVYYGLPASALVSGGLVFNLG